MRKVAFIPDAKVNIISLSCLTRKGVCLKLEKNGVVAEFEEQILMTAREH
jgi:hypothetical protein